MTREIKFKAKRKDNNEWVEGSLLILESGYYIVPINTYHNEIDITKDCTVNAIWEEQDYFKIIPETVSQYTGLKDKNDVEIYENDIVKARYIEKNGYIKWNTTNASFQVKGIPSHTLKRADELEVIGNIYDKEVN